METELVMGEARSVGEFRKNLQDLIELRQSLQYETEETTSIDASFVEHVDVSLQPIETSQSEIKSGQKKSFGKLIPTKESNPLLDQKVTVFKPTSWIDCISLESQRIFVHDKWIVARIALPVSRLGGLHELLQ